MSLPAQRIALIVPLCLGAVACGRPDPATRGRGKRAHVGPARPESAPSAAPWRAHVPETIDLDRAVRDPAFLAKALATTYGTAAAALPSHRFRGTSSVQVRYRDDNGEGPWRLDVESAIEVDGQGRYHAVQHNSADYGREIYFDGEELFIRSRYGAFHRRPPVDRSESTQLRQEIFADLAAYFDLFAHAAMASDRGRVDAGARAGRKVLVELAKAAGKPRRQRSPQRTWRETVKVGELRGEMVLDEATGVPLSGRLSGSATYRREGRDVVMALTVSHRLSDFGAVEAISVPSGEGVVSLAPQPDEGSERDLLLRDLAAPRRPTTSRPERRETTRSPPPGEAGP